MAKLVIQICHESVDASDTRTIEGYDGRAIAVGDRIELHPATDLWMRGARFGDLHDVDSNGVAWILVDKMPGVRVCANMNLRKA